MKAAYPIVMTKGKEHIIVYVPDFNINTEGADYADAMEMARDAIGLVGIDMEDDNEKLPKPSSIDEAKSGAENGIVTLVDVDFTEYRRKNDMKTVRRNVSLPSWLDVAAKEANVNVSAVLARALKQELNLAERETIKQQGAGNRPFLLCMEGMTWANNTSSCSCGTD